MENPSHNDASFEDDQKEKKEARIPCLSSIGDLERMVTKMNLKFTQHTNEFLLQVIMKTLGPALSQKLIQKMVERGEIEYNDSDNFEVEAVLDMAIQEDEETGKDVEMYLVKWKGWSAKYNTWEPASNMEDCQEHIQVFLNLIANGLTTQDIQKTFTLKQVQDTNNEKILDLWTRIQNKEDLTPLKLLNEQALMDGGDNKNKNDKRVQSLLCPSLEPPRKKRKLAVDINNKKSHGYKKLHAEVQAALKRWEREINAINTDPAGVVVENNVDLEGPPSKFVYINKSRPTEGLEIPDDPMTGCECENCLDERRSCCGAAAGSEFAYYTNKRLRVPYGTPIYECNKLCKCGEACPNRVVQKGRKVRVAIFRTSNSRGWGIKTLQKIKRGTFVMEYVGEVITSEEAERRGQKYDAEGMTYLFDLDYDDMDNCHFTVDAGFYGNVSHFVNHSCDPNLEVYGVWINTLDPRLPRIAFFSKRDIEKGEELTFDYMMCGDSPQLETEQVGQELGEEPERDAETGESSQPQVVKSDGPIQEDQPTQSISEMLSAMEQVSDESSQDSMNSNQSAVSSVKSNQSAEGSTESSQASEGYVKSGNRRSSQVLKATTQNSDHDQEELSSHSDNQNSDNNDDAKSLTSVQSADTNTDTKSEDSYKENNEPTQVRKIVVNPVEMADLDLIKTGKPGEVPALAKLSEDKATVPKTDNDSDAEVEPIPSTSNGDITPVKENANNPGTGFFKRKMKSPFKRTNSGPEGGSSQEVKKKFRIMCQCGAKNCRKYLF